MYHNAPNSNSLHLDKSDLTFTGVSNRCQEFYSTLRLANGQYDENSPGCFDSADLSAIYYYYNFKINNHKMSNVCSYRK